ncbi:MAG: HAD family hydrolase [Terricaulis sp.]
MKSSPSLVLFDRDGTLNVDRGYTHKPEDLIWLAGAREAVRLVNEHGSFAVVVTNQAGIGRGLYDEAAMHRFHQHMQHDLETIGARIDAFYFCPFHADAVIERYRHANHPERKPNPGMVLAALRDFDVDRQHAVLIGDQQADLEAAAAAGIVGVTANGEPLDAIVRNVLHRLKPPD